MPRPAGPGGPAVRRDGTRENHRQVAAQAEVYRLQPRPFHPRKNAEAQETFKQSFAGLLKYYLLSGVADSPIELWFQDEARVGQQGTHAYIWAPIGSRPPMARDNR